MTSVYHLWAQSTSPWYHTVLLFFCASYFDSFVWWNYFEFVLIFLCFCVFILAISDIYDIFLFDLWNCDLIAGSWQRWDVFVCVCVCVREMERSWKCVCACVYACVFMCLRCRGDGSVCVREFSMSVTVTGDVYRQSDRGREVASIPLSLFSPFLSFRRNRIWIRMLHFWLIVNLEVFLASCYQDNQTSSLQHSFNSF